MSSESDKLVVLNFPERKKGDDGGGGDMLERLEKRVERLESELSAARIDLATLKERTENLATKAELQTGFAGVYKEITTVHKEMRLQTAWLVGSIFGSMALLFTAIKFFQT
ncbi:hypothetical protein NLH84_001044 [Escherichia coli]|uniref:hypothetical protein n=1 Tax=Citrobacter freundii TaxID=546 RepID=UPI0004276C64|nr:hypothetical protein [Citrobacter freundii]ANZ86059.1 hypothetical protein CfB38_1135 [Citrobacter freundii]EJK5914034.1 hypothetical protein [Escherichia coli]